MKREKKNNQVQKKSTSFKNRKKDPVYQQTKEINFFNIWSLLGIIILIGSIAFGKYITGEFLFFFKDIGSDSINQNYPGLVHKVNLLQEGFFSKWSFYKGIGNSYVGGISIDPYSLFRQLAQFISIKISGIKFLINGNFIRIFIYNFILTGIISFLYFRTLSTKKFTSLIGALLISFSGYMIVGAGWGFASHVFKAIFLLFSFEQLWLKKRWYFFPFAVIWLSTNVYVLYVYSAFLFLYSLFRYFSEKDNTFKGYLILTSKMIFLGFIGIMMNFAQLFRSFRKMYFSPRVIGDASYSNLLSSGKDITEHGNLGATTIFRFFSSDILGSGSNFHGWYNYLEAPLFYIGLISLLLLPQIFIHLDKRKKIIFAGFLGFWFLTLFVPYLRYAILAFTGDYFRYGFDFFIPFTILFFSIFALNKLDENFKLNIPLLIGSLIILIVLLFYPYKSVSEIYINESIRKTVVILLLFYSVLIFLMSKPKYKNFSQIAILILVVFELSYFSYQSYAERVPLTKKEFLKNKAGYADGSIKAVKYIKSIDKTPFFRTEKDYQSGNAIHGSLNDALAQNYYGTTSYSSFNQLNYVRFLEETELIVKGDETSTRWITGFRGYPLLQTFGNVKYHLSKSEYPEFEKFGFDSLARINGITILKNRYYLPFGYTYDRYMDFNDFKKLTEYEITLQSLNSLYQDLSRSIPANEVSSIIDKLKPLLTKKYSDYQTFKDTVKLQIGKDFDKYIIPVTKYSTQNFKNQIALLNGFVYEKEFNKNINLKDFKKISPNDTTVIVQPQKFNFEIYKEITDKLKQDTLQITSFKQSEIKGKINLSKTKLLFLTIPYDKGWKIKVDGKNENLQRVNIGFTGIVLPKGEHKIELHYTPQYYQITNLITFISVLIFWLYLGFYFYKKRKAKTLIHSSH